VFVDAPATRGVGEVGQDHSRGVGEDAVAIHRDPHTAFAEPNDVAFPIPRYIGDETNVFGGNPASCILPKVPDDKGVVVVIPDDDSIETKPDDVSDAGAGGWY